ncbi:MAG TPA: leucyl/phenylalanyl-tRNA--protein transferase [Thermomonas sp.]|nr:leucyl/phenylalanyl-tRNA--protein transferase [Thermomonas sp.]
MSLRIVQLGDDPGAPFPSVERALAEPDGLLAFGGDLSPERLLNAYRHGIFPWFSQDEPPLWWSPSRRAVFRTDGVRLSSRRRRELRKSSLVVRADTCFRNVIEACAQRPRPGQDGGTWITGGMIEAYVDLHRLGHAHSIEVFDGDALVGGVYGLAVGRMFCGESMFSAQSGASSLALAALARRLHAWMWPLIDAQVPNDHTRRLGVETWPRSVYLQALATLRDTPEPAGAWTRRFGEIVAPDLASPSAA